MVQGNNIVSRKKERKKVHLDKRPCSMTKECITKRIFVIIYAQILIFHSDLSIYI